MNVDRFHLYRQMFRSRRFEEAVNRLWHEGYVLAEMHPSLGEEGIAAGVVAALEEGDALALEHRSPAPLVIRGADLFSVLVEMLGEREPARPRAAGPTAVGFALAAERLSPGKIAVAFLGDGTINPTTLLESMRLAVAARLAVIFVGKGGELGERARAVGMEVAEVDGSDAVAVAEAAQAAVERARRGLGPSFVRAHSGRPLVRSGRAGRLASTPNPRRRDPVKRLRRQLARYGTRLDLLEREVESEIEHVLARAARGR